MRINQWPPDFRIRLRKQRFHRYLHKSRIGIILIAIRHCQFHNFGNGMDVVRREQSSSLHTASLPPISLARSRMPRSVRRVPVHQDASRQCPSHHPGPATEAAARHTGFPLRSAAPRLQSDRLRPAIRMQVSRRAFYLHMKLGSIWIRFTARKFCSESGYCTGHCGDCLYADYIVRTARNRALPSATRS